MARNINALNSIRASGDTLPPDLARYIETMPPTVRDKLAQWGILSGSRVAASQPLAEHLADWTTALPAKGNTARHAELVTSRARKVFTGCRFRLWSDLSPSKLQSHGAGLREDRRRADGTMERGIGAQTFNFCLQATGQFCRWMVRDGRATESPLAHLQGLNVKTDRRHDTLPLRADTAALLKAHLAGKMPHAQAVAAPNRTEVSRMFRSQGGANPGPPFGDYLDDGPPHAPVRREPVGGAGRAARLVRPSPADGGGDGNG